MKKSIKKNYLLNVSYQILTLLTPLITMPYVSRILGADGIGTYSYAESVATYFVLLATMGITTYGQREISYLQDDKEKRSQLFWEIKIISGITTIVALLLFFVYLKARNNGIIYYIFAINIIAVFFDVSWFFQGLEEFGIIVLRNVIFKALNIIFIFTMIHEKNDIVLYTIGITGFTLISNISLWPSLFNNLNKVNVRGLRPCRHIKTVISLFIPTIAVQVYTVLDKTMIGVITKSSFENGYYEQALKISRMVLLVVTSLGTVMIPRIGYHYAKREQDVVTELMYKAYRFVWFIGIPLCFGLIGIASNFVPWFYGTGYDKVAVLLSVSSFLILAIGINNVTGMQYLIPTGRQNTFTKTVIIGAVCNFILNCMLIPVMQSVGAAIASVAAETIIAVVQIYYVRKELNPIYILKSSHHYIVAGLIMLVVLKLESYLFKSSIINTLIMIISSACIYFILLVVFRDGFFINNIRNVANKFKKKKSN